MVSKRYTSWGDGGGLRAVIRDWLVLVGALATLRVVCGLGSVPAEAFTALIPALVLTGVCQKMIHRHVLAARRQARALRHVVVVGEPPTVDAVVEQLAQRTDHEYVIVGSCPVGEGEVHSGVPVCVRLPCEEPETPEADATAVSGQPTNSRPTWSSWRRAATCRASGCAGCPGCCTTGAAR